MSNTLKKSFVFKRFYPELVEKYGTARAKDIWNYAENEFLGLRIAATIDLLSRYKAYRHRKRWFYDHKLAIANI